jgi:thioredoxin-like negative regulator of GroEL
MNKSVMLLGVVGLCAALGTITYEKTVKSRTDFTQEIQKFSHAVVIFYETKFDSKEERKEYEKSFKNARRAFDSVSKMSRYKDASIAFLRVDLDKEELARVAERYGINELPTYMLFLDGRPLTTQQGVTVKRTGFLEKDEVKDLIERHYGKDINSILKELSRLRQREREERVQSGWSPYFYWGYGGGYPYGNPYYYAPGYGSAGFGITIGG